MRCRKWLVRSSEETSAWGLITVVSATPGYCHRSAAMSSQRFLHRLRWFSRVEGVSTLLLFGIAMPLKYLAGMAWVVTLVGGIHGALFVALVVMFLVAIGRVPMTPALAMTGIVAAVFPFGPFWFDRRLATLGERSQSSSPPDP